MNYRDYFKKEAVAAQLKNEPKLTNVSPAELEKGTKHEMEHTTDERTAKIIAAQHLKDDPHYYSKLDKAGIDECGLDSNGGLPKLGGALAIPHVGQPIHMSKIIQVGPIGGGPASGTLGGLTPCASKKGVAADRGGIPAKVDGDKEPITAGGKKLDPSIAMKSVGGQVVAGEGEKQGGPNSQGTIANTAKLAEGGNNSQAPKLGQDITIDLQEHKQAIRKAVKEVLKEITFNKKTGKWERLNENTIDEVEKAEPVDIQKRNFGASHGGFEPNVYQEELNMKMGPSYKAPAARQYRTSDDDQARAVQYEPEITERYSEEEESQLQEQYFRLLTKKDLLKESEMQRMKQIRERLEKIRSLRESVNMKMGPSYKVVSPTQARCSDCDHARTVQYEPEMTESEDERGLIDYTSDIQKSKKGSDIQRAGEKFLKQIHQDIDSEKASGKVHSFDDIDEAGGTPINIDVSKLGDVEVDGVDSSDYPDFVDAYITSATIDGRELSDQELDWLNDQHPEIAQQAAHGNLQSAGDFASDAAKDRAMGFEEAGGAAVQHRSFRTAQDNPQIVKNRHRGNVDETTKKSEVHKTIERGIKGKTSTKKQKLTYKAPKTTKSGVVKKRD